MSPPPAGCDAHAEYFRFWTQMDWFAAVSCPFTDQLGTTVVALAFFGGLGMAYWSFSDSASLPVVLALIFGSTAMVHLPSQALNLSGVVVLMAAAAGAYLLWHRLKER